MNDQAIKSLIKLCQSAQVNITLEACQTGVVAKVSASRGGVHSETYAYLDQNGTENAKLLEHAVQRVQ